MGCVVLLRSRQSVAVTFAASLQPQRVPAVVAPVMVPSNTQPRSVVVEEVP